MKTQLSSIPQNDAIAERVNGILKEEYQAFEKAKVIRPAHPQQGQALLIFQCITKTRDEIAAFTEKTVSKNRKNATRPIKNQRICLTKS